jgi:predicted N-acyltransferase
VSEPPRILDSLESVDPARWDELAGGNPTLAHAFLHSLHASGCASEATGWAPRFLTLWEGGRLEGAVPLYVKSHSRGEYVFDWAWADAYERHGLSYYPKLLAAVPFTPAAGARLLASSDEVRGRLAHALLESARASAVSSLHVLFPAEADARALRAAGMLERSGVQFHWRNPGYARFDDFLGALSTTSARRSARSAGAWPKRACGCAAPPVGRPPRPTGTSSRSAIGAPTASTARRHTWTAGSSASSPSACRTTCCW